MFTQVSKYRGEVSSSAEHTSISHSCGAGVVEGRGWITEGRMSHKTAEHERCAVLRALAPLSSICSGMGAWQGRREAATWRDVLLSKGWEMLCEAELVASSSL